MPDSRYQIRDGGCPHTGRQMADTGFLMADGGSQHEAEAPNKLILDVPSKGCYEIANERLEKTDNWRYILQKCQSNRRE